MRQQTGRTRPYTPTDGADLLAYLCGSMPASHELGLAVFEHGSGTPGSRISCHRGGPPRPDTVGASVRGNVPWG